MSLIAIAIGAMLLLHVVSARLLFLVRGRLGWITYLANIISELFVKKIGWARNWVEFTAALLGLTFLQLGGVPWHWSLSAALLIVGLEYWVRRVELRILADAYTSIDTIGLKNATTASTRALALGYPSPSTHPRLTINLIGPFIERMPKYKLGTLLVGRCFLLQVVLGNHTIVPTQTSVRVRLHHAEELSSEKPTEIMAPRLDPAQVYEVRFELTVQAEGGAGAIEILVEWGHLEEVLAISYDRSIHPKNLSIEAAKFVRYPGGCRSAFAWRGDMDLYDESTLQSIEGLKVTFGLAARYRLPQTMYLSTRLSLDQAAAQTWANYYGVNRGAARIPAFVEWIKQNVDLRHLCSYPFYSHKPFVIELGNHGHLHYGTETSGALENGWNPKSKIGAGKYSWQGEDRSSLGEQRDNALESRRWCENLFRFTPKSWAMPDRTNDQFTAAAMEAAGCEVLSDSNAQTRHNVLLQPPPHHPPGTSAVELTKRYPGDPQHVFHVAMNHFWIHRAHRKAIPVVFMCHQHMRQFDGHACARLTEYTLRHVITSFKGDLHINTVYGVGKYWREVLSPKTKTISVGIDNDSILIQNRGDLDLVDAPLDITIANGCKMTILITLPMGQEKIVKLCGIISE